MVSSDVVFLGSMLSQARHFLCSKQDIPCVPSRTRLKNREDGSDFDDFWTKTIAAAQIFFGRPNTHDPEILATRNTSYLTVSKSLNGQKIARMAPILTIFGPKSSQRRDLFFEKFSFVSSVRKKFKK